MSWYHSIPSLLLSATCAFQPLAEETTESAVTYMPAPTLGNNLVAYAKASWISHLYRIPLLYRPFPYSDQLALSYQKGKDEALPIFKTETVIHSLADISCSASASTLFSVPNSEDKASHYKGRVYFNPSSWCQIDWEDQSFRTSLSEAISPIVPLSLPQLPEGAFSAAFHIPWSGGEPSLPDDMRPLRFPPLSWYYEQLNYLTSLCGDYPLYVCLFTNYPDPLQLKHEFEKSFSSPNLSFAYCICNESDGEHALEALFAMSQFECLVRPLGNFSLIAGAISEAKLLIYPLGYRYIQKGVFIDSTHMTYRAPLQLYQKKSIPAQ